LRGHIDSCTLEQIAGWALKDDGRAPEVVIEVDSKIVGSLLPNIFRKDLNANCGFRHQFTPPLANAVSVRAYFKDTGNDLSNSPFDLKFRLQPPPAEALAWSQTIELPPASEMKLIGSNSPEIFVAQGTRMARVIAGEIREYFGEFRKDLRILDFGCGVGRVLLPISRAHSARWFGCDVNKGAIDYLKRAVPEVATTQTNFRPPLPFEDNSFDCVYSISIWTHLPMDMQLPWLAEIRRILRPGGLALISTSGGYVVDLRRRRGDAGWTEPRRVCRRRFRLNQAAMAA
jgi:Methyltransferase domain